MENPPDDVHRVVGVWGCLKVKALCHCLSHPFLRMQKAVTKELRQSCSAVRKNRQKMRFTSAFYHLSLFLSLKLERQCVLCVHIWSTRLTVLPFSPPSLHIQCVTFPCAHFQSLHVQWVSSLHARTLARRKIPVASSLLAVTETLKCCPFFPIC